MAEMYQVMKSTEKMNIEGFFSNRRPRGHCTQLSCRRLKKSVLRRKKSALNYETPDIKDIKVKSLDFFFP